MYVYLYIIYMSLYMYISVQMRCAQNSHCVMWKREAGVILPSMVTCVRILPCVHGSRGLRKVFGGPWGSFRDPGRSGVRGQVWGSQ